MRGEKGENVERSERKMNSEKRSSTVVRRKKNVRSQNKELRQSMYDISANINELEISERPAAGLKRSRSFHVTEHKLIQPRSAREILRQYVENIHGIDLEDLEHETSDNIEHIDGEFPIHEAIEKHHIKDLAIYLVRNENLNIEQKNNYGQTPLIFAVAMGLVEVVNLLIASGSTVNCKDNYGVTALRYAVEGGDFEMASLLISSGANAESVKNGF